MTETIKTDPSCPASMAITVKLGCNLDKNAAVRKHQLKLTQL